MEIALSFTLVIMATITLMLGINVIIYDDINQKHNQHYVELCFASSIWSVSYACIGLIKEEQLGIFFRCVGFIGILLALTKGLILVSIWMNISRKWQKRIQGYAIIMSMIVYPQVIQSDNIIFEDTRYGHFFRYHHIYLGRYIFDVYIISITVIAGFMLYYGFKNSKRKRMRNMGKASIVCIGMLIIGQCFDIVLPMFNIHSFPSSSIAQFFSVLLVYFIAIRYNVSRITIANVSEYIYSVVDTPILVLDAEERVQLANSSAGLFLQSPSDQMIGKKISEFFMTEQEMVDNEESLNIFAKCLINGAKCDLRINEIMDRYDEYLGKIIVVTDMTDKINLIEKLDESREEAVQANKAKSAFLANMSHEIRTPMNTIIGMSELLLKQEIAPGVKQEIMSIRNAGSGLLYIINDILDISKIESGKFEIINSPYMLSSLVVDVVNMMSVRLVDKGIYFLVKVDNRLPANLIGDDLRIKQILINIVGNAIKFTKHGFIKLSITGRYESKEELVIIIQVEDSGIGIRKEDMPKLFGIFNQVDTRRNRSIKGTGLGLAISKELSELMGGSIKVASEYGEGTIFTIELRQRVEDTRAVSSIENKERLLLLIYEPDEVLNDYYTSTFDEMGVKYLCCNSLEEVLKMKHYSHFLIRSGLLKTLRQDQIAKIPKEKVITVLTIEEESKNKYDGYNHVFMPLFCFQIVNILNNEQVAYEYGKREFDVSMPRPMPFASVLIVDDNETNLHVARGLMGMYRMKISTALSGFEALKLVKENHYDVIFLDHMMPEMDGIDTAKRIREMEGDYYKKVPIVALTANAMSGARESFMTEGFDDFLAKPIEYKELDRILREFVLINAPEGYETTLLEAEQIYLEELEQQSHIAGVDMKKKIEEFGGNVELYHSVLHTYLDDIRNRKIEIISLYEEKNWRNFIISVHAIKSASYNIGADQFGDFSEQMETAAKAGAYEFVRKEFNLYIEAVDQLIGVIGSYIEEIDKGKKEHKRGKSASLSRASLLTLKQLCEEMELSELERELKRLDEFSYGKEQQDLFERLKESYNEFEYEAFIGQIKEYLN